MNEIVFVSGARPNFMKVAPVLRALRRTSFTEVLVHTGQHYDFAMSGVFFDELGIRAPQVHLDVGSATHGVQTGRIMAAFETYLLAQPSRPRGIVVFGDVNSTVAGALVGVKLGIPVAHVEAGLRSFDRAMPEEVNRVVTDAIADLLLVSEPSGMGNLAAEGVAAERIRYVGNVMIDTVVDQLPAARALGVIEKRGLTRGAYAIVTLHRPSNVDTQTRLHELVEFIERVAAAMPVVFPAHPRTKATLDHHGLTERLRGVPSVQMTTPLGYREFLGLMEGARVVVTDSGGIQEETSYLGVPCITLRTSTERPVTVSHGTNTLVGDDLDAAWRAVETTTGPRAAAPIEGWDGHAAERIIDALATAWG